MQTEKNKIVNKSCNVKNAHFLMAGVVTGVHKEAATKKWTIRVKTRGIINTYKDFECKPDYEIGEKVYKGQTIKTAQEDM